MSKWMKRKRRRRRIRRRKTRYRGIRRKELPCFFLFANDFSFIIDRFQILPLFPIFSIDSLLESLKSLTPHHTVPIFHTAINRIIINWSFIHLLNLNVDLQNARRIRHVFIQIIRLFDRPFINVLAIKPKYLTDFSHIFFS